MAQIKASNKDKVYTIKKWLGVNENPDGDTGLKMGEASTMTNFKITNDNAVQKRPGTQNVANLLSDYTVTTAAESETLATELNSTALAYTMYPNYEVLDNGLISLSGASASVNYANHATYADYYYQDVGGNTYKFDDVVYTAATGGTAVTGGTVSVGAETLMFTLWSSYSPSPYLTLLPTLQIVNGAVSVTGNGESLLSPTETYKYYTDTSNLTYQVTRSSGIQDGAGGTKYISWYGYPITVLENNTYEWDFFAVTVEADTGDAPVQGLWSGRVGATEYIVAACDGRLWALTETDNVWTKENIGAVDTTNKVHFFGFDEKLYIMNGVAYMSWDATTHTEHTYTCLGSESGNYYIVVDSVNYKFSLSTPTVGHLLVFSEADLSLKLNGVTHAYTTGSVTTETNLTSSLVDTTVYNPPVTVVGYRPRTHTATPPAGGGTLLEPINMLNGLRRVQYSPAASATAYQLPETAIASVDYVRNLVTGTDYTLTTHYTVNLTTGVVTFGTAPANGTNTIEIAYTSSTTLRSSIEAMTLSEFFNGANDNRVFVYGDGTNKAFYSGLDSIGQPTAEYFPDLNVAHIGEANTAITSMIRHYDRLVAFKEDSAYSLRYDILELVNGVTTASFYISTINKGVGCVGMGQAQNVVNNPRTLDGRSIYEWVATNTSGNISSDQRNAQDVSKKVYNTIREMTLANATTFYDKVNQEYYVVQNGIALVQNTNTITRDNPLGCWYVYRDFPAICMIVYKDELYFGTDGGYIRHVSRNYLHDVGEPIQCYWESGAMDFGKSFRKKYSDSVWIVLKPEDYSSLNVTIVTDKMTAFDDEEVLADYTEVATGFFSYLNLNYAHFTYNINGNPQTQRRKIKAKGFVWYKLIFSSATTDSTATALRAEIKVRETGMVK